MSANNLLPVSWKRRGWTAGRLAAGAALVFVAFIATSAAWEDIYQIASRDEESSHIFLVPIVFAWLVWARRQRLRRVTPTHTFVGPLLIAFGWLFYSVGDFRLYQSMWHLGAIIVVVGALASVAGWPVLRAFLPAFFVLGFLVPIPGFAREAIALPLQTVTAEVTQKVLEVFWIDAIRTGNVLNIEGVDVAIAEACNGLRMVFALVLVSYVFAYTTPLRNPVRVIIVLASPVSAILCNVIRLVPTVALFGYSSTDFAEGFHDVSGWVMLPVGFLMLLGIVRLMRWAMIPVYRYSLAYGNMI